MRLSVVRRRTEITFSKIPSAVAGFFRPLFGPFCNQHGWPIVPIGPGSKTRFRGAPRAQPLNFAAHMAAQEALKLNAGQKVAVDATHCMSMTYGFPATRRSAIEVEM
jgi:hypothetical protein